MKIKTLIRTICFYCVMIAVSILSTARNEPTYAAGVGSISGTPTPAPGFIPVYSIMVLTSSFASLQSDLASIVQSGGHVITVIVNPATQLPVIIFRQG